MKYQDFNIRINNKSGDGYDVSVDSPAGSASEHIKLPFDIGEIAKHIQNMGGNVRGGATREAVYEGEDTLSPAEFGEQLYDSLFTGNIGAMYNRSEGMVAADPDPETGLRIKLRLNLEDPDVSALAQIPWEFVYSAEGMAYLNLSRKTPVVRYIEVPKPPSAHALKGNLRVLVVMSSPKDLHPLDLEKERKLIESSWAGLEDVEVDFLDHPTKDSLLDKIRDDRYHVLHYMGHGAFDEVSGKGALALEDDSGNKDMLDAETFGTWLQDAPRMRLAFLNACDTAKNDEDEPFAGVANRLVMSGLPAVIAMQFPISDEAAIDFSKTFYKRIVSGFPVDEATAQGRKAILAGKSGTMEWGTPVLYMRAPDGQLFDAKTKEAATPVQPAPPRKDPVQPSNTAGVPKAALVAAGVAGIAAIAWFVIGALSDDPDFVYLTNPVEVTVGGTEKIQFTLDDAEVSTLDLNYYPKTMTVSGGATLIEVGEYTLVSLGDKVVWQARITGLDAGTAEINAAVFAHENEPPLNYPVDVNVSVAQAVQDEKTAAFADASDPAIGTLAAIDRLNKIDLSTTGATMRGDIIAQAASLQSVLDLRVAAEDILPKTDRTLTEKIEALKTWKSAFEEVRAPITADHSVDLNNQLNTLSARPNIARIIFCGTYNGCSESITTHKAGEYNFFVSTEPETEDLKCKISGPETKECDLYDGGARYLMRSGTYTVTITNGDGELLGTQSITTY